MSYSQIFDPASGVHIRTRMVDVDGVELEVPKGIGRNNRNQSWQLKFNRNGELLVGGNFADRTYGGAEQSLQAACEAFQAALESEEVRKKAVKGVRGGKVPGVRLGAYLTVNWRIVNGGPSLYASIYCPEKGRSKSVLLGTDKALANDSTELRKQLALALALNERTAEGVSPFEPLEGVSERFRIEAVKISVDEEFTRLVEDGRRLRSQE